MGNFAMRYNEKPFATTRNFRRHCEGLFNIKGEYENLFLKGKAMGEINRCLSLTIGILLYDSKNAIYAL